MGISTDFKTFSAKWLPCIETQLHSAIAFDLTDKRNTLFKAIQHSVTTPGKRIRPLICIAINQSINQQTNVGLTIGCAIELIHCYSLIHDDLPAMDNDDFRRGKPTCHKAYGEDIAILAGDTLNTYAFEYLTRELNPFVSPKTILMIIQKFANACGIHGMAGGQVLDILSTNNDSLDTLKHIHALKTGRLLESCFELTAMALLDDDDIIQKYQQVGKHFGLMFQIIDDILDEIGTLTTLGKSPGKDAQQNKLTYVSKCGLEEAKALAMQEQSAAQTILKTLPYSNHDLMTIIDYVLSKGIPNE